MKDFGQQQKYTTKAWAGNRNVKMVLHGQKQKYVGLGIYNVGFGRYNVRLG